MVKYRRMKFGDIEVGKKFFYKQNYYEIVKLTTEKFFAKIVDDTSGLYAFKISSINQFKIFVVE